MGLRLQNWVISALLIGSMAAPARAESRQIERLLNAESGDFATLMKQADTIATDLINQSFADPTTTKVSLKVLGEREGQIAPLLSVSVSRQDWQTRSSVQQWARYFGGSTTLLGFDRSPDTTQVAAFTPPVPVSENEPNFYDNR
ncbi:hypothetical protein ACKFKF_21840 [Phormidesmis sp. 146-12]